VCGCRDFQPISHAIMKRQHRVDGEKDKAQAAHARCTDCYITKSLGFVEYVGPCCLGKQAASFKIGTAFFKLE
jgi:hypothetical protein